MNAFVIRIIEQESKGRLTINYRSDHMSHGWRFEPTRTYPRRVRTVADSYEDITEVEAPKT